MTVVLPHTMPGDTRLEMLAEVTALMGVEASPPAGLVVHTHVVRDGRVRVIDVWDSGSDYDAFHDHTLVPAMEKVASDHGVDLSQGPQPETVVTTVAGLVRGR
jgi:hypothetical protein